METATEGRHGNFILSIPGVNDISPYHVKCVICNAIIPNGIISMANHDAECGGKENFDKVEKLAKLYKEGFLTMKGFTAAVREVYGIAADDKSDMLLAVEKFLHL